MRICRFNDDRLGIAEDDHIIDVTSVLDGLPSHRYPLPRVDPLIAHLAALRPKLEAAARGGARTPVASAKLLSPVANPGKLVAAPVNYKKHLEEASTDPEIHHNKQVAQIQQVGVFLKATSSLIGAGEPVTIAFPEKRNDHEVELVAIIGKPCKNVSKEQALDYVAGYAIGLDMTVRGPEERSMRKSPDSYSVLGPWLVTSDELPDPSGLQMTLTINGELRQSANTRDLILHVRDLIAWASSFYTLQPGDVFYTGTPEGVGPVKAGDVIDAQIEKIGAMQVHVRGA